MRNRPLAGPPRRPCLYPGLWQQQQQVSGCRETDVELCLRVPSRLERRPALEGACSYAGSRSEGGDHTAECQSELKGDHEPGRKTCSEAYPLLAVSACEAWQRPTHSRKMEDRCSPCARLQTYASRSSERQQQRHRSADVSSREVAFPS